MISPGIKGRLWLLAILPMAGVATVLSIYFIHSQLKELDQALNAHGESLARYLARASEYPVFSGNHDMLANLVLQTLQEQNVVAVTVTDQLGRPLVKRQRDDGQAKPGARRSFTEPITQHVLASLEQDELFYGEPQPPDGAARPLGWVNVELSLEELEAEKNRQIAHSLGITLGGLLLSLLLAGRLRRSLTRPLLKLHRAAREIRRGNLDIDIRREASGELGTLEEGFQAMAEALRTSRRNLQQQIDRATEGLRESIATVEAQNAELREARLQALAASKTKSAFLANMSHELRTPMNGILGFTRLLKKTPLSDEQADYVETIEKSADNLLNLLNDILDISRIEAGKLRIEQAPCNLRDSIDDALELLAPAAQEKGLELISLYYDDVPEAVITAGPRVRQILLNLVGNAIKFSPSGDVVVRTQLEEEDGSRLLLRISISDQGIGISREAQERLFNSFEQIDNTLSRPHQGAGLGLAISRSLAEMLGGEIGVDSRPGEGATFWFTLACQRLATADEGSRHTTRHAGSAAAVYDASPTAGLALVHLLRSRGFECHQHELPETLLRQVDGDSPPELLFVAIDMRGGDEDLLEQLLRRREQGRLPRLILLVNSVDPATLLTVRRQYGCPCLSKPLRRGELFDLLADPQDGGTRDDTGEAPSPVVPPPRLDGCRLLVAEDNIINARLLEHGLRQAGAEVRMASDGQQALEAWRAGDIDVIVMDIHMPRMNGLQATRQIRLEEGKDRHVPVICLTASLIDSERREQEEAGIDAVLLKPVDEVQLIELIRSLSPCAGDAPARPAEEQPPPGSTPGPDEMLRQEIPAVREAFRRAQAAADWSRLREHSHRFLGGLAYCRAEALHEAARSLHARLREGDPQAIEAALDKVYLEMDSLLERDGDGGKAPGH